MQLHCIAQPQHVVHIATGDARQIRAVKVARGVGDNHAERVFHREVHVADGVLHALQQGDVRAGKRAVFVDQTVFFDEDAHPARQGKFADIRADGVHGIGDENEAVFADEFAGDGEREGVNVHAVGDDAAVEAQFGGTADNARFATHQRWHGVIEVGHAAETFSESTLHIGFRGHGVRGVDADAKLADAADGARRDAFRRQRDDAVLQVGGVFFVAGEVFVIGGGKIYSSILDRADRIYLTQVEARFPEADTFFPQINQTEWVELSREEFPQDERNEYPSALVILSRKK